MHGDSLKVTRRRGKKCYGVLNQNCNYARVCPHSRGYLINSYDLDDDRSVFFRTIWGNISRDVMVVVVVVVGVIRDARLTLTTFNVEKQANIFLTGSSRETASNSRRELTINLSTGDGGLKFKRDP